MPASNESLRAKSRSARVAYAFSVILLLGAIALLWWPVVSHYRVTVRVDDSVIDAHRSKPSDDVLTLVADVSMMTDHPLQGDAAVAAAERILRGELALPALPVLRIDPEFSSDDLVRGVPVQQVWMASLIVPDLLLRAYEHSPNDAYLKAAGRYLANFIDYEARQIIPSGMLWNAHAIANRAAILSRYWKFVRPNADAETSRRVHSHATRTGALLLKPELFVGMTNHGVMQNVALLQLAVAFPSLPDAARYRTTALSRLQLQLPFYINQEGAVLEHSSGYHFHGVVLTGFLQRLLPLAGEAIPPALTAAHDSSLKVLQQLQRPDRSLPLIGNTYRYAWRLPEVVTADDRQENKSFESFTALHPSAGYAIRLHHEAPVPSHTAIHWGYFPGHGHSRAQEMSLHIWADQTDWSTNSGYWPGDDASGIALTDGWDGGNAPHVVGEEVDRRRHTRLHGAAKLDDVEILDLERSTPGSVSVRRQIVQVGATTWIALDSFVDPKQRPLRVLWTAAPESSVSNSSANRFEFVKEGSTVKLTLDLHGAAGTTSTVLRGSRDPFGGWVAFDRKAHPAPGVDARVPASPSAWMAAVLQLSVQDQAANRTTRIVRFDNAESWELEVVDGERRRAIRRAGSEVSLFMSADKSQRKVTLETPDVATEHAAIASAGDKVRSQFPRTRLFEQEREKVFVVIVASWVLMLAFLFVVARWWSILHRTAFGVAHAVWIGGIFWLLFGYLRA